MSSAWNDVKAGANYVPIMSNIEGAANGNWTQAALGPADPRLYSANSPGAQLINQIPGGSSVTGALGGVTGALTPASTAGVQGAAADAKRIQDAYWAQYQLQQPQNAPQMQAASMQAAQAAQTPGVTAAQMTPQQALAAQMNTQGLTPWSQGQQQLAGSLQNTISNPNASSVAQIQQQRAFAQQEAQQQGLAAALGRGGNTALALRTAMGNMGNLGAQAASAAALQRANEVAQAQGQLGNVLQQGAGNALTVAGSDQSAQQATNLANLSAATQAASQNAQQQQAAGTVNAQLAAQLAQFNAANQQQADQVNAGNQQTANANNQSSQLTAQGQTIQQQLGLGGLMNNANSNQVGAQVGALNAQNQSKQITGNLLSTGLGAAATMSDERVKEDVRELSPELMSDFYQKAVPASWRYAGSPQPQVGPMAQDLERSAVGRTMVRDTPTGKVIDHGPAITGLLAAVADLGRRQAALEAGSGGKLAAAIRRKAA